MTCSLPENPIVFTCNGNRLVGIVTQPEHANQTGVLIIVGGPQYRAGSHRQFTLMARRLTQEGIASFRFDYRGMGDSEGELRYFEDIKDDVRTAIDAFQHSRPEVRRIVLWGLCDAASAALYYAHTDPRVTGLILLNPWVHSATGEAKVRLKNYYLTRLMQRSFWIKLLGGGIKIKQSVGDLAQSTRLANSNKSSAPNSPTDSRHGSSGYIERMLDGLVDFKGKVQIILSDNDLVAKEFQQLLKSNKSWSKACSNNRVKITTVEDANHTFSSTTWRNQAENISLVACKSII
jgi:exosortase A-associated hydrolase 1